MASILITGATDGIGLQTAHELAKMGHEVILHGRTKEKLAHSKEVLLKRNPKAKLQIVAGDLSSFEQIHQLAQSLLNNDTPIDVLINNAGIYMNQRELSEDGFEMTFAVNHLAPFLLTNLLLERISRSADPRVITVSSVAHTRGEIDFRNLNSERGFNAYSAYANSKLCNVLFSNYLARLHPEIKSNSLHPGVITTKLLMKGFKTTGASVEEGARTSVFLATDSGLKNTANYFVNCKVEKCSAIAEDFDMQKKLWDYSADVCGLL